MDGERRAYRLAGRTLLLMTHSSRARALFTGIGPTRRLRTPFDELPKRREIGALTHLAEEDRRQPSDSLSGCRISGGMRSDTRHQSRVLL
jgi:hypothetical protein